MKKKLAPGQKEFIPTNRSLISEYIRLHQPISRAAIARALGLSRAAVSANIDALIQEGIVYEQGLGESTVQGGRRPIRLFFNPKSAYIAGIDVGGTKTLLCISDLSGNVVFRNKFPTAHFEDPTLFFQQISREVDDGLAACNVTRQALLGIGVAVPGVVNVRTGIVTHIPALGWSYVNVKAILRQLFSCEIYIDNDVNAAALGERWKGVAQGVDDLFMVTVGTGVGGAVIANGHLCRGADGASGEIGYFVVSNGDVEQYVNDPDSFGSFERIASGTGITERARNILRTAPPLPPDPPLIVKLAGGSIEDVTAVHVLSAAKEGDPVAWDILDMPIRYMAIGIANIVSLLNPKMVVVGGGIAQSGETYLRAIREWVEKLTPLPVSIVPAALGNDAGAIGAIAGVLHAN